MEPLLDIARSFLTPRNALLLTGLTLALAAVSALLVPVMLARLPEDYLLTEHDPLRVRLAEASWPGRLEIVGRNLLGLILLLLGVAMLFMPGQGMLTVLVGLALTDFPGKRRLERRLLARPGVGKAVDWLRARKSQPPFLLVRPADAPEDAAG